MAEITQTLGFDVSQALQALAQFDKALKSTNENLERLAKTTSQFNKTNRAIETNLKATNRATQRLTVSWGYLTSRILYTQFVVSYFGKFRRTLEQAAESAVDYQNRIAEITTISPGQSFDQISASVRRLSDQFNVPLLEEAAALLSDSQQRHKRCCRSYPIPCRSEPFCPCYQQHNGKQRQPSQRGRQVVWFVNRRYRQGGGRLV